MSDEPELLPPDPGGKLDYRSGIDERKDRPRVPIGVQTLLGFLASAVAMLAAGFFGGLLADGKLHGLMLVALVAGVLTVLAFGLRGNEKHRGWVLGLLLGVGIAGLLDGYCFMMIAR